MLNTFYSLKLLYSRIHPVIHMLTELWGKFLLLLHPLAQRTDVGSDKRILNKNFKAHLYHCLKYSAK